jgi:hypothetical protein
MKTRNLLVSTQERADLWSTKGLLEGVASLMDSAVRGIHVVEPAEANTMSTCIKKK